LAEFIVVDAIAIILVKVEKIDSTATGLFKVGLPYLPVTWVNRFAVPPIV
jgi:hypothetical protein